MYFLSLDTCELTTGVFLNCTGFGGQATTQSTLGTSLGFGNTTAATQQTAATGNLGGCCRLETVLNK